MSDTARMMTGALTVLILGGIGASFLVEGSRGFGFALLVAAAFRGFVLVQQYNQLHAEDEA